MEYTEDYVIEQLDAQADRQKERNHEMLRRLSKLLYKGYRINPYMTDDSSIFLESPAKAAPDLVLHANGELWARQGNINPKHARDKSWIDNRTDEHQREFDAFLKTVPLPTWGERTADDRWKYIYGPLFMIAFAVVIYFATNFLTSAWHNLFG
jgi:hypothetical protein